MTQTCKDTFANHPASIVGLAGGHACTTPVLGAGWMCETHAAMSHALLSQEISDEAPAARGGGPGVAANDPVWEAKRHAAAEYLAAYRGTNSFMLDLRADRKFGTKWFRITEKMADAILRVRDREATWAQAKAATPGKPAAAPASEGWYMVDGVVYKVQKAVHGSGRNYAKRLEVVTGEDHAHGEWVYAPGAVNTLSDADRLTVEEAAKYGRLYGMCMVCGATLTDEDSIEAGIGPVCSKNLGRWMA